MIQAINDLSEVLKSDAKLFFFDIEDTILASNIFYDLIGYKEYCKVFLELCKDVKIFDVTYLGKNYRRVLMQSNIPDIMIQLRERGCKIFALTSGYPSHQKKSKIKELGIKFDGFLFTRGGDKGPFLLKFLNVNNLQGKCAFIDNHYEKISSVDQSFTETFQNEDKIDLFLYQKEFVHSISMQDFINYWKNVIAGVKRGEVEKLKAILQKEKEKKQRQKNKQN
jgi:hypothetical protein